MQAENKNLSYYKKKVIPSGKNLRIGIVVSEWNHNITENLFTGAYKTLLDLEVDKHNIERINVPGSFELIYGAKIISKRKLDAIICLGSIIKGETKHFDFISNAIANGIQELNIKLNIPVIFGVLTDNSFEQAVERSGGKYGNKGIESAVTSIKMASLNKQ